MQASPTVAPPPRTLLHSVEGLHLLFQPGTRYRYSNSDNIIVALMIEAVTHRSYAAELHALVLGPLGLSRTSLPEGPTMTAPFLHGYAMQPGESPEDVSEVLAAGWSWASGGIVSTPAQVNRFARGYVSGRTTNAATRSAQFHFIKGSSEPPGPGTNSAGLALFRYATSCGTVYGHTGNTLGYTQFMAANATGTRSVSISVTGQLTPSRTPVLFKHLRQVFALGVCAALAKP